MGWIENLSSHLKKLMLMEYEMDRMSENLDVIKHAVNDHEKRLIRIETMIEMSSKRDGTPKIN